MWFGRIVLSQAGLLVVLLAAGIYLFFFYQDPPLVILNDPVPTDKQQYKAGDRIVISVNAEIRSQSPSTLYIRWRGDPQPVGVPISELPIGSFPLGLQDRTFPIAAVPQILLPGTYYLEVRSFYEVSFLNIDRNVFWRSTSFEVIRSPSSESVPITAYLFMTDQPAAVSIEISKVLPALPAVIATPVPIVATPTATSTPLAAPISIATSIPVHRDAPNSKPTLESTTEPTTEPTPTVQPSDPVLPIVPTIALPDIPPLPPLPTIEIPPLPTISLPIKLPSVVPTITLPSLPTVVPDILR
jgi:hypothetical protein